MSLSSFDETKFYLGKLCIHGHDWNDTGFSLRTRKKWECIGCKSVRDRLYRERHREKVRQVKKDYYNSNKEYFAARNKTYRQNNKDKLREKQREYCNKNRIAIREYKARWKRNNPEKVKAGAARYSKNNRERRQINLRNYRARKARTHQVNYSVKQVRQRLAQFEYRCAYCCTELAPHGQKTQMDHFLPISQGGSDSLGNLVPACISCNSGKCDRDPIAWFRSQAFYSDRGLKKILKVLGKTEATYNQIPLL